MLEELRKNITEVNEGHSMDGEYVGFVLIGMMLLKVNMEGSMVVEGRNIGSIDWKEVVIKYDEDGGDEEYGEFSKWGGMVDVVMSLGNKVEVSV